MVLWLWSMGEQSMTAADTARLEHLLDQLAVGLRRIGISDPLPPGLTAAEISTLTSALPRPLPVELIVFYSWHNGFALTPLPMPFAPQSLEYAVKRTRERRLEVEAVAEDLDWDPDVIWPRTWLLIGGYYEGIVVECDVPYATKPQCCFQSRRSPGPTRRLWRPRSPRWSPGGWSFSTTAATDTTPPPACQLATTRACRRT